MFSEISQNSQENTCARDSSLIKLQAETSSFIKKDCGTGVFRAFIIIYNIIIESLGNICGWQEKFFGEENISKD